jgi:hypothetical protein
LGVNSATRSAIKPENQFMGSSFIDFSLCSHQS